MSFKNNKVNSEKTFNNKSPFNKGKLNIGVGGESLIENIEYLVKKNFGIPNIFHGEGRHAEKWLSSIEALRSKVSPQRLYNMAKNSLRGTMIHWFNAFEDEEFNNIDSLIFFLKKEFQEADEDHDLRAWELIVRGPEGREILDFTYELKVYVKMQMYL
ncbi:hypothetical protein DMUE_1544 [Dictyocoela muelleri]|nr:hypothetical protein DMUE_1544 [Dictyocoela muelleri]